MINEIMNDDKLITQSVHVNTFDSSCLRAKWYKAVYEKKYRPAAAKGESERCTLEALRSQNQELKVALTRMEEEFPYLGHNLKKINALLPSADSGPAGVV